MGTQRLWEDENIKARYKAGHGRGLGADYKPWLRVQDFPSHSPQTRIQSTIFKRAIHTFSYLERYMYLFLEFEGGITDYREQFPLGQAVTLAAAEKLGIHHGVYRSSGEPVVMTIDALVTRQSIWLEGWDAKPMHQLKKKRVVERLLLQKAGCEAVGATHHIFTEQSVSKRYLRNLDRVRSARLRTGEIARSHTLFSVHRTIVQSLICQKSSRTIAEFCKSYDRENSLMPGDTTRLVFDLIWSHGLIVDLDVEHLHETKLRSIRQGTVSQPESPKRKIRVATNLEELLYV